MDAHTRDILEFDKILALIAGYAACSLGKEAARALGPLNDLGLIRQKQALTTEMTAAIAAGLVPPLGGLRDLRASARRAQTGASLTPEELAETAGVLRAIGELDRWLARIADGFPRLAATRERIGEFAGVANAIESCLDRRANVLDTASRQLSEIRRQLAQTEDRIQQLLRQLIRSESVRRILRYPNYTMVGHHYVLPIAAEHRGLLAGSVHRTSATHGTVYVEPQAIAEQSAELSFHRGKEQKEVRRILRWLSAQVGQVADSLLASLNACGEIDLLHAQARYSREFEMTPPVLNDDGRVRLRQARHPLLDHLFKSGNRSVVPIDVDLGGPTRILVITGPNTGGKTVALKTVALLAAMAQSGLHIPAGEGSRLPVFDAIMADIGDEQSLEQSLSTFSSHVRRVGAILRSVSEKSLVILDELGAGTDPAEGAALGRSILDELDAIGVLALVTTHIGDLKSYAFTNPRAQNAAVEFDLETLQPKYRLIIGDVGESNALQIARRLDLPADIVDRASAYLAQRGGEKVHEIEVLRQLRAEVERANRAAIEAKADADNARASLEQHLANLGQQTEHAAKLEQARAQLRPGDGVVVPRFGYDRPGRVVKIDTRKQMAVVSIGKVQWDVPIGELIPQS